MAEIGVILVPILFEDVSKKLHHLFSNDFALATRAAYDDFEKLEATLDNFQHMVQKEREKGFKYAATKDWLRRLMHVANEADEIMEDALDEERPPRPYCTRYRPDDPYSDRHNYHGRIAAVIEKFDRLESEKRELDLGEIDINRETGSTSSSETQVFGRIEAKEEIINTILSTVNIQASDTPFVYAVIGSGGIGKTTLAQYVYNDKHVVEHFDTRIWVWVSESFDVKKVLRKIINHFEKTDFGYFETLRERVKQLLNEKRFLLVLDDIWSEDVEKWNKLKCSLNCGVSGSSVLLTTRQPNVASIAGAHDHHDIALSEDLCWHLLKESSSLECNQESRELEEIGKEIVKKCGGLPIAAKTLGGSLRLTRVVSEWESVRDSQIWEVERSDDIPPALKLSLDLLEPYSKHCFAFSSVFPKGYAINKENLIHLWMANDLVPSGQGLEPEDMGNKIANELVAKSFFEFSRDCVKMHDLMHDLGHALRDECFCLEGPRAASIPPPILHLSINVEYQQVPVLYILETFAKSHPSLHTCIVVNSEYIHHCGNRDFNEKYFFNNLDLHCLRALDLCQTKMKVLPESIEKFKQLKYLNLERTYLEYLSDSMCTLTKLQTLKLGGSRRLTHLPDGITQLINLRHLDLRGCENLTRLPAGISKMTNLRYLDVSFCSKLTQLPNGISQLVYLQTLGLFIVGQETGQRITELQGLNRLRGSLEIRGLEHVRDAKEADKAILKQKKNLSSLSLVWGRLEGRNNSIDNVEGVLGALQPPQSLNEKLFIEGYRGPVFGNWMRLMENLVEIKLKDCINCKRLPALGHLTHLKVLTIIGMKSLKCIGTEFYGSSKIGSRKMFPPPEKLKSQDMQVKSLKWIANEFNDSSSCSERRNIFPSLEKLEFEDMPILEEWCGADVKDGQQTSLCPRLKKLTLRMCPELTSLPSLTLSSVQQLEIGGYYNKVIVRSLPCHTSLTLFRTKSSTGRSLQNPAALKILEFKYNNYMNDLPDRLSNLTSLRTLTIQACYRLKSFWVPLPHLSSLESLTIRSCDQLNFSNCGEIDIDPLQTLKVRYLPKLTSFPQLRNLSTLQSLSICNCDNLFSLPPEIHYLSLLENLTFANCEYLKFSRGDFEGLVNLRILVLYRLPRLVSLPEMHHFRSLEALYVMKCQNFQKSEAGWPENLKSLFHGLKLPQNLKCLSYTWIESGRCGYIVEL